LNKKQVNIHKNQEPWKRKEPNQRFSKKTRLNQKKSEKEAIQMMNNSVQNVEIIIYKDLGFIVPKRIKSFKVKLSIALKKEDIDQRMRMAFPELNWKEHN
jgi:hypothetical protein